MLKTVDVRLLCPALSWLLKRGVERAGEQAGTAIADYHQSGWPRPLAKRPRAPARGSGAWLTTKPRQSDHSGSVAGRHRLLDVVSVAMNTLF